MPGIKKGLAYIGIWLVCSSIVIDATNPQDGVSELSSQNNSATRAQESFESISRLLVLGNSKDSQDQHRIINIHLGSGNIIQQYGSIEKEKNETELSKMFRSHLFSGNHSTRIQLDETASSPCPYSTSSSKWLPSDCWEIYQSGCRVSGIYEIKPRMPSADAFSVYCEMDAHGGGWTVLQNRIDGSLSFFQRWHKYKDGFGSLAGEFWLGLERIYQLTNSKRYELLIELEDFDRETRFAVYDNFVLSSEEQMYSMRNLGSYTGTAGDSLSRHMGRKFSTWDQDNDEQPKHNCAISHGGGWWFEQCASSMLNGHYLERDFEMNLRDCSVRAGIEWDAWRGWEYSYKKSRMSIRPLNR